MNTETLIHAMLTTNTGTHMLDSGGDYGRNWQRNQGKTLADFQAEPAALLDWYVKRDDDGKIISAHPEVTTSVFHKLTSGIIWQDDLCREFNAMPCDDWRGDYYGTSVDQTEWLDLHGFEQRRGCDGWNTYNWAANFSQTMQRNGRQPAHNRIKSLNNNRLERMSHRQNQYCARKVNPRVSANQRMRKT